MKTCGGIFNAFFFSIFFFFFCCRLDGFCGAGVSGLETATATATHDPTNALDLFMVPLPQQQEAEANKVPIAKLSTDFSMAWYREFVVSRHRRFDYLLLFTCCRATSEDPTQIVREDQQDPASSESPEKDLEDDEEEEEQEEPIGCEADDSQVNLQALHTALAPMYDAPTRFPFVQSLRVVHVPSQKYPEVTKYHGITSTPSLMLLFRRESPFFQRRNLTKPANELNPFVVLPALAFDSAATLVHALDQEEVINQVTSLLVDVQRRLLFTAPEILSRDVSLDPLDARTSSGSSWARLGFVVAFLVMFALCSGGISNDMMQMVLDSMQRVLCQRRHWFLVSAMVMYISLSGTIFSLLNRVPWMFVSPMNGAVRLVYPSGSSQFLGEGLIAGMWSFWVSLCSFGIVEVLPRLSKTSSKDEMLQSALLAIVIPSFFLWMTFFEKNAFLMR